MNEDFFKELDDKETKPSIPVIMGGGSIVVSQSEDSIVISDGNPSGSEGGNGSGAGDGEDGSDGSNGGNGNGGGGVNHTHENVGSGAFIIKADVGDPPVEGEVVEVRSLRFDDETYSVPGAFPDDKKPLWLEIEEDTDEILISGYADPQKLFHPSAAAPLLREASVVVPPGLAEDPNGSGIGHDLPVKIARGKNGLKAQDSGTDAFEITPDLAYWKFSIFKVGDTGNPSVNIASSSVFSGYDPDSYPTYGIRFPVTNNKISGGHTIVNTVNPYTGTGVDQTFCTIPVCLLGQIYVWGGAYQESIIAVDGKPVTVLNKI